MRANLVLLSIGLFCAGHTLACEDVSPCTSASCSERVSAGSHTVKVFRNYPLGSTVCGVDKAVVVIHGSSRNADDYFTRMISATSTAGELNDTLVLAPNFVTRDDVITSGDLYWSSSGWKQGNTSNNDSAHVSSFEVVDRLIDGIKNRYPEIDFTIIGHSAGGQFVNRYAAGAAHADMQFVVANPSSYMYLSAHRPVSGAIDLFEQYDGSGCSAFNEYKYGLEDRNAYMRQLSSQGLISNYKGRQVTYMLGSEDVERDSGLATSCRAELQGSNRLMRGQAFFNYMNTYFPDHTHEFVLVDGVGHSSTGMFNSPEGIEVVYGLAEEAPNSPPSTPTGLDVPVVGETSLSLAWTASEDSDGSVSGYHVFRDGSEVAFVSDTPFTDTGLDAGTSYQYHLQAEDDDGARSASSSVFGATTLPVPSESDDTSPTVTITYPRWSDVLEGGTSIVVQASASDDTGVTHVDFYIEGGHECSDSSAPYTCRYKLSGDPYRIVEIGAVAFDAAGNADVHTVHVLQFRSVGRYRY